MSQKQHQLIFGWLSLIAASLTGCSHRDIRPAVAAPHAQVQKAVPDPDGWHQVDGDSSDTHSSRNALNPPLHVVWRCQNPAERGPLVACGATLYVADDNVIAAVDRDTGRTLWSQDDHPGFFDYFTSPPSANAAATGMGLIYSDALRGTTICLAARDGHTLFQTDTRQRDIMWGNNLGAILLLDDRHFLTAGFGWDVAPDLADTQSVETPQPRLKMLDSLTGRLLLEANAPHTNQIGVIPGSGQRLFLGADVEVFTLSGGMQGKLTGEFYTDDKHPVVSAQAGRVFLVCYPRVYCLNMKLKPLWFRTMPGAINPATAALGYPAPNTGDKFGTSPFSNGLGELRHFVVVTPRRIIVGNWQRLYGLDPVTGRTVWTAPWKGYPGQFYPNRYNILTPPVAAGEVLYALSRSSPKGALDSVTAWSVPTGRVLWSGRVGSNLRSLIVHDGALYVGDEVDVETKHPSHFILKLSAES